MYSTKTRRALARHEEQLDRFYSEFGERVPKSQRKPIRKKGQRTPEMKDRALSPNYRDADYCDSMMHKKMSARSGHIAVSQD